MNDLELIQSLKQLKNISPQTEYASISKLLIMMSKNKDFESIPEKAVVENVSALKSVQPSEKYAAQSKSILMAQPRTIVKKFLNGFSVRNILAQGTSYGLSVGLAAVLMAIIVGGGITYFKALPGVDASALIAEANTVIKDIDIHLEDANYYAVSADKTRVALGQAQSNELDHSNSAIIEKESRDMNFESPTNNEINDLLNEATL